jgi:hypothetical protein
VLSSDMLGTVTRVPPRLTVNLRESDSGEVYVEAVCTEAVPPQAFEYMSAQIGWIEESQSNLLLAQITVGLPHTWKDPAAPWLGVGFEGATEKRFLDISRDSEERRLLAQLATQDGFDVVWPREERRISQHDPAQPQRLSEILERSENVDAETWREATYTLTRHLNLDLGYSFGDRQKAGPKTTSPRRTKTRPPDAPFFAPEPGELPAEGEPIVEGITLPEGRRWPTGPPPYAPDSEEILWCSEAASEHAVTLAARLAEVFPRTGLWPCLWPTFDEPASYCRFPSELDAIDAADPEQVLRELWELPGEPEPEWVAPFVDGFPGLAPATAGRETPEPFASFASHDSEGRAARLMLVPCRRPGEVIAAIGFECGPEGSRAANDVALLSSVLCSWEERFHAVLVALEPDVLQLAVGAPPATPEHALAVAAELYAFATLDESGTPGALRGLARAVVGEQPHTSVSRHIWRLGWSD